MTKVKDLKELIAVLQNLLDKEGNKRVYGCDPNYVFNSVTVSELVVYNYNNQVHLLGKED